MSREISMWGQVANKILFDLAYMDERRGFEPLRDKLPKCLNVKWEYVSMAEVAEAEGRPWELDEFVTLCMEGFAKIIGDVSRATTLQSQELKTAEGSQ
jgi:hypothetical protein